MSNTFADHGVIVYRGPFLLYFNRHVDAPRVWTIAALDRAWEVNVIAIVCNVALSSGYERREPTADHDGPPSAWFEGWGEVNVLDDGRAVIVDCPLA